jgi:hypothetical protein
MQSPISFHYYCLNCKNLMETSDAPVMSGTFVCGLCAARMTLDAANAIGLAQAYLARNIPTHDDTLASDKSAGTVWNHTQSRHLVGLHT